MPHPHTSEAHHTTLINTHPKLFSQPSSAYIRSSSLKPHQHTSEAHLSTLISTHPKLFSQPSSAHIRSSSLKSHISTHPKLISQPSSAHIRSSSLKPHQHTSEALLSSPTKQSPKLRISINQSISQPIRPTIFFHNYNPKSSKNKFKYYTKTLQYIQTSLYSPIPSRQTAKKLTPPTSSAAPMPHHLPADHKETQPLQPSSAALMAHPFPANHHTSHPKNQNGQTASGAAAWSGPGASE